MRHGIAVVRDAVWALERVVRRMVFARQIRYLVSYDPQRKVLVRWISPSDTETL